MGEGEEFFPVFFCAAEFLEAFFEDGEEERSCGDYYTLNLVRRSDVQVEGDGIWSST